MGRSAERAKAPSAKDEATRPGRRDADRIADQSTDSARSAEPTDLLALQRVLGNRATTAIARSTAGRPLPSGARSRMETLFASDFSSVRMASRPPTNPWAAASAVGEELRVPPGRSLDERRMEPVLAHELTHVLQHRAGRVRESDRSVLEAEAEGVRQSVESGRAVPVVRGAGSAPGVGSGTAEGSVELNFLPPAAAGVVGWYIRTCVKKYGMWLLGQEVKLGLEKVADEAVAKLKEVVEPTIQQSKEYIDTIKRIYRLAKLIESAVDFATAALISPAAMALAEAAGVDDPELVSTVTRITSEATARMAVYLLLERPMMLMSSQLDVVIQQTREGSVQTALSTLDSVSSGGQMFDIWRTVDHYAFLRFLYKEKPTSAVELIAKAKTGVQGMDSTLSGLSVEARQLAKQQIRMPSLSMIGFNVIGEMAYGAYQMVRGNEQSTVWNGGRYLARGLGSGAGSYAMSALAAWGLPALGFLTGPYVWIPSIILSGLGSYVGRKVFESAYVSAPTLWSSFSAWMWPTTPKGRPGGPSSASGSLSLTLGGSNLSPSPSLTSNQVVPDSSPEQSLDGPTGQEVQKTLPTAPLTSTQLTILQIALILTYQQKRSSQFGLIVPVYPTWNRLIGVGLGGPSVGLAAALTGLPLTHFLPPPMRTPQIVEVVDREPPSGSQHELGSDQTSEDLSSDRSEPTDRRAPPKEKELAIVSGKMLNVLGDLVEVGDKVLTE